MGYNTLKRSLIIMIILALPLVSCLIPVLLVPVQKRPTIIKVSFLLILVLSCVDAVVVKDIMLTSAPPILHQSLVFDISRIVVLTVITVIRMLILTREKS